MKATQLIMNQDLHTHPDVESLSTSFITSMSRTLQLETGDILLTDASLQQLQETIYPVPTDLTGLTRLSASTGARPLTFVFQRGPRLFFNIAGLTGAGTQSGELPVPSTLAQGGLATTDVPIVYS